MSITYAGTTLAITDEIPDFSAATTDAERLAVFRALTFVKGVCALHETPGIMREWAKVSEPLVCRLTNRDIKGSSKWQPVNLKFSRLPGDAAQDIYVELEASRTGVGAFELVLPESNGWFYFTAQVSKFNPMDGGGQDVIHTSTAELLIQDNDVLFTTTAPV